MIPRIVHRIWFGPPMADELVAYGETWERHHPGWKHRLWTEEDLPKLQNQRLFDAAEEIAGAEAGQLRSDIARYELLHRYGGVYVDCDLECLRSIEQLVGGIDCFAGWEHQHRWVGNTILGAASRHPFFAALIDGLPHNVRRRRGARPNKLTGPQFLTRVYRRGHIDSVVVFDQALFYPYAYNELERAGEDYGNAYTAHHWANQRRRRGVALAGGA